MSFVPDTLNISVGDTVRLDLGRGRPQRHHAAIHARPMSSFVPLMIRTATQGTLSGEGVRCTSTPLTQAGTYCYFCFAHCAIGMTGVVNVISASDILLYGSTGGDNANGGGRLWLIDVTIQNASLIGDTGFDRLGGIAFDSSGTALRRLRRE